MKSPLMFSTTEYRRLTPDPYDWLELALLHGEQCRTVSPSLHGCFDLDMAKHRDVGSSRTDADTLLCLCHTYIWNLYVAKGCVVFCLCLA
jgi:hypothetical protein